MGSIPGLGRSPGEGKGYTLQYSGLEESVDCTVHAVTKSQTRLSDFHFHFCMKCSLGISSFLEEKIQVLPISSLSHSIVSLYFFALITEEGFLISPCYSLKFCIQMGIAFLFSFAFHSLVFSAICKASSDSQFAFVHFIFSGIVLIPPEWCYKPLSLQALYQT